MAALRELGVEPSLETFNQRKVIQKLCYLLESFGVDLGFRFGWYLHGPYSSNVAHVLYDNPEAFSAKADTNVLSEEEKIKIKAMRNFLGEDLGVPDALELLVSLHFLLHAVQTSGSGGERDVIETLRKLKPSFSQEQVERAYRKAKQIPS